MPQTTPIKHSPAEQQIRRDLAACYRLVTLFGWDDHIATHISARLPDQNFLINPFGLLFEEITASSLIKIDISGNILEPSDYPVNRAGFVIHSAVHEVRADAGCVMHLHTRDGAAVAALREGLLPLNQTALSIAHDMSFHEYEGIAVDLDERSRLQTDLGTKHAMLLRNHGTLTLGKSVASAFYRMYMLEWACATQVRTLGMGRELHLPMPAVIAKVTAQTTPSNMERFAQEQFWPAMLRRIDRKLPGYAG
jgi:ribulose-5-phosphate 4-epimerase/fuculose-1-phosphate aldolase